MFQVSGLNYRECRAQAIAKKEMEWEWAGRLA